MGGKGSGRVTAEKRTTELENFAEGMSGVNKILEAAENQLTRIFARGEVPGGFYVMMFSTLREELKEAHMRALRLERHTKDELCRRRLMEGDGA